MKKTYLFILTFLALNSTCFSQSIYRSKKELNSNKNSSSSTSSKSSDNSQNNYTSSDNIGLLLKIFGYVTFGVFKYGLIGDYNNENHLGNNLNTHPFSENGRGNYSETDSIGTRTSRLDVENKFVTSGNIIRGNHLDIKIRPLKYFYVSSDWYQLYENNDFTKKNDALTLVYFNLAYDRVRFENFNLGWTIGASYIVNEVRKGGFSYGVNAEYFLNKNISLSFDSKWSSINQNPVNSLELKGKYFKKNYFAAISYKRLKIGTPLYNLIGIGAGIYF